MIQKSTTDCGCVITVYGDGSAPPDVEYCDTHSTIKAEDVMEGILAELSYEHAGRANYPREEGETWSASRIRELSAQLALLHRLGISPYSGAMINSTLFSYHNGVSQASNDGVQCLDWILLTQKRPQGGSNNE